VAFLHQDDRVKVRHARHLGPAFGRPEHKPCAGHPRLKNPSAMKTWMAATSPAMTEKKR
jgi:hypothetical protein